MVSTTAQKQRSRGRRSASGSPPDQHPPTGGPLQGRRLSPKAGLDHGALIRGDRRDAITSDRLRALSAVRLRALSAVYIYRHPKFVKVLSENFFGVYCRYCFTLKMIEERPMRYCLAVKKSRNTIPTWLAKHPVCELTAVIGKMTQKGGGRYQRGRLVEPSTSRFFHVLSMLSAIIYNMGSMPYASLISASALEFPVDELGLHRVVRHAALTRTLLNKRKTHDGRERLRGAKFVIVLFKRSMSKPGSQLCRPRPKAVQSFHRHQKTSCTPDSSVLIKLLHA